MATQLPWGCAFISGGGSGIGRQFAERLAASGANVAIFNRSDASSVIAELKALASSSSQQFISLRADVSQPQSLEAAFTEAVATIGQPDLAINSAGIQIPGRFREQPCDDFDKVVDINLKGSQHFAAKVVPHLRDQGQLVLVASLAGLLSNYAYGAYCASKYGIVGLAEVLRTELKPDGIDVSVCCPGEIPTPLVEREREGLDPVGIKLKQIAGQMPLDKACDAMLKGMAKRRFMLVPGWQAKMSAWFSRHFPGLLRVSTDFLVRWFMRGERKKG